MSKYLILFILCVEALLANISEISFDKFTAKSALSKDGKYNGLDIYDAKSGKLLQEIRGVFVECAHKPYILGYKGKSPSFLYFCDLGDSPEVFWYGDKDGEFFPDEFTFNTTVNEILEGKDHIIMLSYPSDVQNAQINIFEKSSKKYIQTFSDIESECNYYNSGEEDKEFYGTCLSEGDFNFDGNEDFSLLNMSGSLGNSNSYYFLYDRKDKKFFLSEIEGTSLWFDNEKKIIIETSRCCAGRSTQSTTYKLADNKMVKLEEHCYIYDGWENDEYAEYDCGAYISNEFYFTSTGLKKNFELRIRIMGDDFSKGEARYKGQKESLQLKLKYKSDKIIVFDEFYKEAASGTYTLNLDEYGIAASGFYKHKDGKRFELKAIER
ncbi:MAG: hypothetical protein LBP40_07455 [Campylobacteraceae bacterium]|nr:hypothetical protein [Campylobacteraceae bacterium]